jgi:hypothetical protein
LIAVVVREASIRLWGMRICHWSIALPTKLAGNSSVPTSRRKVAIGKEVNNLNNLNSWKN